MLTPTELPVLKIRTSLLRQAPILGLLIVVAAGMVAMTVFGGPVIPLRISSAFGALVLVPVIVAMVRKAVRSGGEVLVLAPEGLQDRRLSDDVIPWTEVIGLHDGRMQASRFIVVGVSPSAWRALDVPAMIRMVTPNAEPSFVMNAHGLPIRHDDLYELLAWYRELALGELPASTPPPATVDRFRSPAMTAAAR